LLNSGVHIADRTILYGDIPEADPSLVTDGYATVRSAFGTVTVLPEYVLVIADIVSGDAPVAIVDYWVYSEPPIADMLVSNWQRLGSAAFQDGTGPSMGIIPVAGFSRFAAIVSSVSGVPVSVRLRYVAVSSQIVNALIAMGSISFGYRHVELADSDDHAQALVGAEIEYPGSIGISVDPGSHIAFECIAEHCTFGFYGSMNGINWQNVSQCLLDNTATNLPGDITVASGADIYTMYDLENMPFAYIKVLVSYPDATNKFYCRMIIPNRGPGR